MSISSCNVFTAVTWHKGDEEWHPSDFYLRETLLTILMIMTIMMMTVIRTLSCFLLLLPCITGKNSKIIFRFSHINNLHDPCTTTQHIWLLPGYWWWATWQLLTALLRINLYSFKPFETNINQKMAWMAVVVMLTRSFLLHDNNIAMLFYLTKFVFLIILLLCCDQGWLSWGYSLWQSVRHRMFYNVLQSCGLINLSTVFSIWHYVIYRNLQLPYT